MLNKVKQDVQNQAAITRRDLTNYLAARYSKQLPAEKVKEFVDQFFAVISDSLSEGHTIKLPCFGTFSIVQKNSRPGRNPRTGEEVEIVARKVIRFRPSKKLRNRK